MYISKINPIPDITASIPPDITSCGTSEIYLLMLGQKTIITNPKTNSNVHIVFIFICISPFVSYIFIVSLRFAAVNFKFF